MRKLVALAGMLFLMPLMSMAQDYSKADFSVGASYLRQEKKNLLGWQSSIAGNINRNLAIVADASGYYGSDTQTFAGVQTDVNRSIHSLMVGPKVSDPRGRWTPFAQALFGWSRTHSKADISANQNVFLSVPNSDNAFGASLGGGLDYLLNDSVSLRIAEIDYFVLNTHGQKPQGVRFTAGLVFHLGTRRQ